MDILLLTPPGSNVSLVQYRMIGGVMDLYFYSGPSPKDVIEQHAALVGLPTWQPYWGFGFHLCRYAYVRFFLSYELTPPSTDGDTTLLMKRENK